MKFLEKQKGMSRMLLALLLAFAVANCGAEAESAADGGDSGDDATYENSNLPSKYRVSIPSSLSSSSSSAKIIDRRHGKSAKRNVDGGDEQAFGYYYLKDTIRMMMDRSSELEMEIMMIDAAIPGIREYIAANNPADGKVPEGAIEITFTQQMYNKMEEFFSEMEMFMEEDMGGFDDGSGGGDFPDGGGEFNTMDDPSMDMDPSAFLPEVGSKMPNPPLRYVEEDVDGYNYLVEYLPMEMDGPDGGDAFGGEEINFEFSTKIRWNDARDQIKIATRSKDEFSFFDPGTGQEVTESFEFNTSFEFLPTADGKGTMRYSDTSKDSFGESRYAATLSECGADDCVEVNMTFTFTPKDPTMGEKFSDKTFGKADDFGGFIETEFIDPMGKQYIREYFDGDGTLTGLQFKEGGVWSNAPGFEDFSDEGNEYAGDLLGADGDMDFENFEGIEVIEAQVNGLTVSGEFPFYVIVLGDADPANPENHVGVVFPADVSNTELIVDYWGPKDKMGQAKVYLEGFNESTGELSYTVQSGATISQASM